MTYSRIIGTGSYLPKNRVSNFDLEKKVDTSHDWIVDRTGIEYRHISNEDETASMMSEAAARAAIEAADLTPGDIDLIIVGSTSPDKIMPGVACLLQERLKIPGVPAFDINAACSGFVYALSIADQFIKTGMFKRALVLGAEVMSSVIDWTDRRTCVLFGDGAGAVVLEASDEPGILSTHLHADGSYKDILYVPTALPGRAKEDEPAYINMSGQEVFKFAVNTLEDVCKEALEANGMPQGDIDWFIPHQANLRIIKATAKKLKLSLDKVIMTVSEHANTSAASVPLALDQGVRDGRIKRGDKILMEAIGGGFTWGAALLVY